MFTNFWNLFQVFVYQMFDFQSIEFINSMKTENFLFSIFRNSLIYKKIEIISIFSEFHLRDLKYNQKAIDNYTNSTSDKLNKSWKKF